MPSPLLVLLAVSLHRQEPGELKPNRLRCEYAVDPIGIGVRVPRLSWIDESGVRGDTQSAYEIRAASSPEKLRRPDVWDSGKVESDETTQIEYGGPALNSRQRVYWTVTVWDASGHAPRTSRPAFWEMGLLDKADWKGEWIGAPYTKGEARQATYLVKDLKVERPIARARVYVTARGLYELYLNGETVGKDLLTPGWTDYRKRIQYQTYDITKDVVKGTDRFGMVLGDGWYCGHVGLTGGENYGTHPMGLAQIEIEYKDGTKEIASTDRSWIRIPGPIRSDDLLMGETFDARWNLKAFGMLREGMVSMGVTQPLAIESEPLAGVQLVAQSDPTVQVLAELKPKTMWKAADGAYVFDLGQNMVGFARLQAHGDAGKTVRLRFAEMLNPDRTIYTTNLRGAKATDYYTLSGQGTEVWQPTFTFHGFRYVELTGYPGVPGMDAVTGIVIGTNNPQAGTFACDNELVNKLQHNIYWGERGNYLSVPTDCPQRDERLGWMGDAEVFAPTATCNNDVAAFLSKFTQDTEDAQSPAGGFSDVSPRMGDQSDGAPAWGDAGVIIPWAIYENYGDKRILAERYGAMRKWIEYIDSVNPDHLWIKRSNNNFGDWLNVQDDTPRDVIATAYFAHSTDLLARSARVLGKADDAAKYRALCQAIREAFVSHFVGGDVLIKGDTQTDYVLALAFDLLPEAMRARAAERLVAHIHDRKDHLSTGFVGVGSLCPTLTRFGHTDLAYKLLENDTYPSWGYSIRQGATTIWERWDGWTQEKGFQDPGMNSFNHYSLGSVGRWMYETVAGIAPDPAAPGYKRFIVHPIMGPGINSARASLMTMHGEIKTAWNYSAHRFHLDLTVPVNTMATVYVPEGASLIMGVQAPLVQESGQPIVLSNGVGFRGRREDCEVYELGGGTYHFDSTPRYVSGPRR
jgi:alpha-L-rhamnosidase